MHKLLLSLTLLSVCVTFALSARFPLYKQCDPRWANVTMGVPNMDGDDTICHQGCAMSSFSMALAGYGFTIEGQVPTPYTLNKWLTQNNGYVCAGGDCCNLVLNSVEALSTSSMSIKCMGEPNVPSLSTLRKMVEIPLVLLAHVHNRGHFVLITGLDHADPNSFIVNDPFYNSTSYPYDQIHDIIIYDIQPVHNN